MIIKLYEAGGTGVQEVMGNLSVTNKDGLSIAKAHILGDVSKTTSMVFPSEPTMTICVPSQGRDSVDRVTFVNPFCR